MAQVKDDKSGPERYIIEVDVGVDDENRRSSARRLLEKLNAERVDTTVDTVSGLVRAERAEEIKNLIQEAELDVTLSPAPKLEAAMERKFQLPGVAPEKRDYPDLVIDQLIAQVMARHAIGLEALGSSILSGSPGTVLRPITSGALGLIKYLPRGIARSAMKYVVPGVSVRRLDNHVSNYLEPGVGLTAMKTVNGGTVEMAGASTDVFGVGLHEARNPIPVVAQPAVVNYAAADGTLKPALLHVTGGQAPALAVPVAGDDYVRIESPSGPRLGILQVLEVATVEGLTRQVIRVRFSAPLTDGYRQSIEASGVQMTGFEAPDIYDFAGPQEAVANLRQLDFVLESRFYTTEEKLEADLRDILTLPSKLSEHEGRMIDVTAHERKSVKELQRFVHALIPNEPEPLVIDKTVRFDPKGNGDLILAIASMSQVKDVAFAPEFSLCTEHGRNILGLGARSPITKYGLDGKDQIVAVMDSGVDKGHPALAAAFLAGDGSDENGHGTHVAGIIAARVVGSNARLAGIAPGAKIYSIKLPLNGNNLDLKFNAERALKPAYESGARIFNLSFGEPVPGAAYDAFAQSVDSFVYRYPDALVVTAAGNSGSFVHGRAKFKTVTSPGIAKNALTVGASCTNRGNNSQTWGQYSQKFSDTAIRDLPVAGDPDVLAPISGRGPTSFKSTKPDLVAPGTYILSTLARGAPNDHPHPKHAGYTYMTGTSMACPMVSGSAAILREYFLKRHGEAEPSAALMKAALVACASRVPTTRPQADQDKVGFPDYDQGFGRLDLSRLPLGQQNAEKLVYVDVANDSNSALAKSGMVSGAYRAYRTYQNAIAGDQHGPLTIVLVWTDPPGRSIQNPVNLTLQRNGRPPVVGNPDGKVDRDPDFGISDPVSGAVYDQLNNVQIIHQSSPEPGPFKVKVKVVRTPQNPQGFSLIVIGDLANADMEET